MTADFDAAFARLRQILEPYGRRMHVTADGPDGYAIDMAGPADRNPTTWFAGIRRGKAYVSFYLMPVYVEPSLLDGISPALRKRMQGKSCFNFRGVDAPLFEELAELTRAAYERTAGDPSWGVGRREERGMEYRTAMSADRATHERRMTAAKAPQAAAPAKPSPSATPTKPSRSGRSS